MTISRRYTVGHFLGYGRRYSIDYCFPQLPASPHTTDTPVASGRVEEVSLAAGVDLFMSDLEVQQPYRSLSRGNTSLLIVVMLEGCAHFDTHNQKRWLTAGEACWLTLDPGFTLSAFHPAHQHLRTLCLSLDATAIQTWYGAHPLTSSPHTWILSPGLRLALEEACRTTGKNASLRLNLHGLALQIMAQGIAADTPPADEQAPLYHQRLELVRRWLDEHYTLDHSLQHLSQRASMSPSTLHRHFKATYGVAPIDYLRRRRLSAAKDLMLRGYSVQQAAHMSGYRHASNFITAFKKAFGISPGALGESSPTG